MAEPRTITLELPEGMSKEDVENLLKKAEKKAERVPIPYVGYSCGRFWVVGGVECGCASRRAADAFIKEFKDVLPEGVERKEVLWAVGVRKLGEAWSLEIEDTLKTIRGLVNSRPKKEAG